MSLEPRFDPTETIQGVAFLLVRDGCVLMERCPKKAARHGGEWFIPGGRIEESDRCPSPSGDSRDGLVNPTREDR
jgi:hypothetical protein